MGAFEIDRGNSGKRVSITREETLLIQQRRVNLRKQVHLVQILKYFAGNDMKQFPGISI